MAIRAFGLFFLAVPILSAGEPADRLGPQVRVNQPLAEAPVHFSPSIAAFDGSSVHNYPSIESSQGTLLETAQTAGGPITTPSVCHSEKLYGPNGEFVDWFGWAIAADGANVLIASRGDDDGGNLAGAAHVYRLFGKSLVHRQQIMPADVEPGDEFGSAVGLHGDRAIVGAWREDERGLDAGAAYIFRLDNGAWVEEAKLTASDGLPGDGFGYAAAISGNYAVVGAYARDDLGFSTGAAYVFHRTGMNWTQQAKLLPFDVGAGDEFGFTVAMDGDVIVIGTPGYDYARPNDGAAHVFRRDGSSWVFTARLLAIDGFDGDHFGRSVSIHGDRIVVGAGGTGDSGLSRGTAYVFAKTPLGWLFEAKLNPGPILNGDRLGGVAIHGKTAAIGIYNEIVDGPAIGYVRLFHREGTTWSTGPSMNDTLAVPDDRYGNAVAISGPLVLVGSYYDGPPYHAGSVYSYWLDDSDDTDMMDYLLMSLCYTGGSPGVADVCCASFDVDQDGDIDLNDYSAFKVTMGGP